MPGVISRILNRVSRFFGSERRSTTFRQPSPGLLTYAKSGAAVGETTAIGISAVWQGLRFISSAVASMPRFVAAEDRAENITYRKTHPIHRLVSVEPHPAYSSYDFFFALVWQTKLRGNGLAVIVRDERTARPRRLDLVEWKDVIDVEMEPESGFVYYKIQGYSRLLPQNEVIHLKNATANGVEGLDTLKVHMDNFGLEIAERDLASYTYRNGAHVNGFLSTDKLIGPDNRESMEKSWNSRFSGPDNAGKTPFLEGGVKYERTSLTPAEAGLNEARQFNVYESARILGVSPHVLFALDRANFSNIETLHQEIGKYTLSPLVEALEAELNRKLFRADEVGRLKVVFNMDSFTRGDTESRAKYIQTMVQSGVFSINEARRMEGKNSVAYGDAFLVPKNMTLIGPDGQILISHDGAPGDSQEDDETTISEGPNPMEQ